MSCRVEALPEVSCCLSQVYVLCLTLFYQYFILPRQKLKENRRNNAICHNFVLHADATFGPCCLSGFSLLRPQFCIKH